MRRIIFLNHIVDNFQKTSKFRGISFLTTWTTGQEQQKIWWKNYEVQHFVSVKTWDDGDVWTTFLGEDINLNLAKKVVFFRLAHVISVYFLTATITADSDIQSKSYPE